MTIREFEYYLKTNAVKKKVPSPALAKSLLAKANKRLARLIKMPVTEEYASLILEDAYEALREAAQSLMEAYGFKPYSHEALIAFLKINQFLDANDIEELNRYRILRNKSVYEAKELSAESGKEALNFAKDTLPKIKAKLLKMLGEDKT